MKLTFLFYEPIEDLSELSRRMARLAELGYEGIELSARHPPPYPAGELKKLSDQHDMPVVSFLSGWSYGHEGLCLASPDHLIRDRAVERLKAYIDYAAPFAAHVVVGLMQGLRSDEPDGTIAAERIVDCLRRAAERAAEQNVSLVLEPVNHLQVGFHHTAAEAAGVVARVGSPGLGYMLDTIHVHIEEHSAIATILAHGEKIRHFHLCESNGGRFGTGSIDFKGVLSALRASGYTGCVSVKVYRHLGWEQAAESAAEVVLPLMEGTTG